ncbi:MAG: histidinol-phosphate transaminase [Pseudomonadota bacterium]
MAATDWIRPEIQALQAYAVPDATGLIKLDAMENPYPWPDTLKATWTDRLQQVALNRYPDPRATDVAAAVRTAFAIPADMDILFGNGSDEIIQMIVLALASPGRILLTVEPGFVMYRMTALSCGLDYVRVPLQTNDFALDRTTLLAAIAQHQPAVIFLACPNNPTGNLFAVEDVAAVLAAAPGLVVIDEAYAPFTTTSYLPQLGQYDNLVVMRTVSKMGLAGLRLGFLAGPPDWLHEFDKVRLPYNINSLTQASAVFALQHHAVFNAQAAQICTERARLTQALATLPGVTVYPSEANFVLLRTPPQQAETWFQHLRQHGILIKSLHRAHPTLRDCLRITIGTPEENDTLLQVLQTRN